MTHRDVKPDNVLRDVAGLAPLSVAAHLVARVVPPARPRRYVSVELRAMFAAGC